MGSGLINVGTRAMFAANAVLDTVAHNISNAQTAGYSRQEVQLATEEGRYTGSGFVGRGVRVQTVVRSADAFLTREVNQNLSVAAGDGTRLAKLQQLEGIFPLGEAGLGYATTEFLNTFVDVANNPQDTSARQVSLARAGDLASRLSSAAGQLDGLQQGVLADLRSSVASVNGIAKEIAYVNQKIASLNGTGQPPNDLLDQRDQLIKQLNGLVSVKTIEAEDGTMGVFVGGGQRLVLGNVAESLGISQDEFDASKARLVITDAGGTRNLDQRAVLGGTIAGLFRVQNEDIVEARNRLGQMAAAVSAQVNDQQALGYWAGPPPDFGSAIFSTVQPQVLPSSGNTSSITVPPLSAALRPGETPLLQASDYRIEMDNTGAVTLTRLKDGWSTALADGVNDIDGMDITVDAASMVAGDRFELRPVGRAAADMRRIMDDPRGIAAASPFTATVAATNAGTASVASLTLTARPDPALPPTTGSPLTLAFTSGTGDYELRDTGGNVVAGGTWQAGQAISYNGFDLRLNGMPRSGDTLQVQTTTYLAGNSGNALALMALRDKPMVGQINLPSGNVIVGDTISDAFSAFVGDMGVRVQGAENAANISGTLAENSAEVLSGTTGVNLDEEAARLIQFQQSYQAAAKIVQIAQTVFTTLLETAR